MNKNSDDKRKTDGNIVQVPRFISTVEAYPLHFGEDPGHVSEDSIGDDSLESIASQ